MMRCGLSGNYPEYPDIEAQLGYNPARFLAQSVGKNSCTAELTAKALIRGVQTVEHLRLWLSVETDLGRGRNDGPRQHVIKWINHRQAQLTNNTEPSTATGIEASEAEAADQDDPTLDDKPEPAGPATTDRSSTSSQPSTRPVADGGDPAPPECPDCNGELTREEIGTETAHWCPCCGGFREPTGGRA